MRSKDLHATAKLRAEIEGLTDKLKARAEAKRGGRRLPVLATVTITAHRAYRWYFCFAGAWLPR
jgi:hypothetical protein